MNLFTPLFSLRATALCALVLVLPSWARAQDGFVELTEQQVELNDQAFQAAIAGEFEKSARLLQASLNLGEANVIYLNLGRSQANAGQCREAVASYDAVESAPRVESPTPEELAEVLLKFRADLAGKCPGWLALSCPVSGTQIQVDSQPAVPCPVQPVELTAGLHKVIAVMGTQRVEHTVEILGAQTTPLELKPDASEAFKRAQEGVARAAVAAIRIARDGPPAPPSGSLDWLAYTLIGTGGAAVITGLILELAVLPPEIDAYRAAGDRGDETTFNEKADTIQALQGATLGLYIGGGLLAAGGVLLLFLGPEDPGAPQVSGWMGPGRMGINVTFSW